MCRPRPRGDANRHVLHACALREAWTGRRLFCLGAVSCAGRLPLGGIRGFAPDSAIAIGLRTASMRWMSRWPIRNLLAGQFAKAADIELPDYTPRARG